MAGPWLLSPELPWTRPPQTRAECEELGFHQQTGHFWCNFAKGQIFSKVSQNQIFPRVVTTLEKAPCAKPLFRLGFLWVSEMGAWLGGFLVLVSAP